MKKEFFKTKREIKNWLDKHKIKNFIIHDDLIVDVEGDVFLWEKNLNWIPVKFGVVRGDFDCSCNQLTSLGFSPEIINGNFYCGDNQLASLKYSPEKVGGSFYCYSNQLTSLEFCPEYIGKRLICSKNNLRSLDFFPEFVGDEIKLDGNELLGDIQNIDDFKTAYIEHKKHLIGRMENSVLNKSLKEKTRAKL